MNQPGSSFKPNILVAPLDWGLGHATRCIPLIRALIHHNCTVFLASEGRAGSLLREEFPHLTILPLKGYNIHYSKNKWTLPLTVVSQIPKILSIIKYENQRLKEWVDQHNLHAVISDNRYGLYHPGIRSVIMTHQLLVKTSMGRLADRLLQASGYRLINRFSECWVPDNEEKPGLSGELGHPAVLPSIPLHYPGPLSRFEERNGQPSEKHLLVLLSGPEPQRTILEQQLLKELEEITVPVVLVRGLPGEKENIALSPHISVFNHLPAAELEKKMLAASMVIARCGYSTVMDLAALKKKSILIPTPGQTEQEYLARQLMKSNFALCLPQQAFRLKNAIELAISFPYQFHPINHSANLDGFVESFLQRLAPSE